jgi:transcriptional regulator with XRE-family HTH domain
MKPQLASHVRLHRRRSGLSQRELASIIGTLGPVGVSRHERSTAMPRFLVAVGYELVFNVPLAELFPGVYETLRSDIEARLSSLEEELHESTATGREAALIARKLEWLWERRNNEFVTSDAQEHQ